MTITTKRPASIPSRRRFLAGAAAGGAATLLGPRLAFATPGIPSRGDTVVSIFLRGGCDGLAMTPPYGYQSYRDLRPTIAIPPPGNPGGALPLTSGSSPTAQFPTGLDGVIGLHPAMSALYNAAWVPGNMAIIPASGLPRSESRTRSHFDAKRYWERGTALGSVRSGWLNRMLTLQGATDPLPGVNTNNNSVTILEGPAKTITVSDLRYFAVDGFRDRSDGQAALNAMYSSSGGRVTQTGADVLGVVDQLQALDADGAPGYPSNNFARDLKHIAVMIRGGLGLRTAAVELSGWDHHNNLGTPGDTDGAFHRRANDLSEGVAAFINDLGPAMDEVTILIMTEFGRTINENGSGGTDHGRGATTVAIGNNIRGGVYGYDYPDVIADDPDDGDLSVLTDFRQPIHEILVNRVGISNPTAIFPTFTPSTPLGLTV